MKVYLVYQRFFMPKYIYNIPKIYFISKNIYYYKEYLLHQKTPIILKYLLYQRIPFISKIYFKLKGICYIKG